MSTCIKIALIGLLSLLSISPATAETAPSYVEGEINNDIWKRHFNAEVTPKCKFMPTAKYVKSMEAMPDPTVREIEISPELLSVFNINWNSKPPVSLDMLSSVHIWERSGAPTYLVAISVNECVVYARSMPKKIIREMFILPNGA